MYTKSAHINYIRTQAGKIYMYVSLIAEVCSILNCLREPLGQKRSHYEGDFASTL